ncbi:MAG TPA: DinB family protein [Terriglobales bacterium]|nr:DinB family protein [Terriglobales bacterium]
MSSPQITPDQAKFILSFALPSLETEHSTTKKVIEAIPLDKGDYRPDAISKTALELAWHIVAAEKRFLRGICTGAFDFSAISRPESVRNSAEIVAWSDAMIAENLPAIQQLSGEQLARIIDFRGVLQFPAVRYIQVCLNHTIHHRGQLSMYLRPMGAKVPSIYGESYDATQARLAKEGKAS